MSVRHLQSEMFMCDIKLVHPMKIRALLFSFLLDRESRDAYVGTENKQFWG